MKHLIIFILLVASSVTSFSQENIFTINDTFCIVKKGEKVGLMNTLKDEFQVAPKYDHYVLWELESIAVFISNKGKIEMAFLNIKTKNIKVKGKLSISKGSYMKYQINDKFYDAQLNEMNDIKEDRTVFHSLNINMYGNYLIYNHDEYEETDGFIEFIETRPGAMIDLNTNDTLIESKRFNYRETIGSCLLVSDSESDSLFIFKKSKKNCVLLKKEAVINHNEISESTLKMVLKEAYEYEDWLYFGKNAFAFLTEGQWGGGILSIDDEKLYPPEYKFFMVDPFNQRMFTYDGEKIDLILKYDYYKDTSAHFAMVTIDDPFNSISEKLIDHDVLNRFNPENLNINNYFFFNKELQQIFFGVRSSFVNNENNFVLDEYGEEMFIEIDSNEISNSLFAGVYDVQQNKMLKYGSHLGVFYNSNKELYSIDFKIGKETRVTWENISKESDILIPVNPLNENKQIEKNVKFVPGPNFDLVSSFDNNHLICKSGKTNLYFPGIPLYTFPWSDVIFSIYDNIIFRKDENFVYFNDSKRALHQEDKFNVYLTDPGGLTTGVFAAQVSPNDSVFFQIDTAKVFDDIDSISPESLLNIVTIKISNQYLIYSTVFRDTYHHYEDMFMEVGVEEELNTCFIIDMKSECKFPKMFYHSIQIEDDFIFAYKGRNVIEENTDTIQNGDYGESYVYDVKEGYYQVLDGNLKALELPKFKDYVKSEHGYYLENNEGEKAIMDEKGQLITDFLYNHISWDADKKGSHCIIYPMEKLDEDGFTMFDDNGDIIYEIEGEEVFVPLK